MHIQLPSAADVMRAVDIWAANDARLNLLLQRYGKPAPALRHYGLVLWEGGQLQSASQALAGSVALMPEDAPVWSDLAGIFGALGQQHEAAACTEASLERDPTQAEMWLRLGAIRTALGDGPGSVDAFHGALERDAGLIDGWIGLGLAYHGAKRFSDAIAPFQEAIRRGRADDATIQACLGEALYSVGDFDGAAAAFAAACDLQPENKALLLKRTRAQFAVDAIRGPAQAAIDACRRQQLPADDIDKTVHDGFHILSAYGHRNAAIALGELQLARSPDDAMQAYLLATLKGEALERAPDGYIVDFFDKFADEFDQKVVGVLGYKVPGELTALAERLSETGGRPISRVLDLGCGTGLAGSCLTHPDRTMTGVDLSPRMLDKARQLGCYDRLIESEVLAFLTATEDRYDLVVAADVLIYFGDLCALFEGVARALDAGGLFAVSVETAEGEPIVHLPSGRFAHGLSYVARVAAETGFTLLDMRQTTIRLDAMGRSLGALIVLSRD